MPSYLLTWNPELSGKDVLQQLRSSPRKDWSCGHRRELPVGSRVYLLKQGPEPRGIVASGFTIGPVFSHRHWDPSKAKTQTNANYVPVVFDVVLPEKKLLSKAQLTRGQLRSVRWDTQISGIQLDSHSESALYDRWEKHAKNQLRSAGREQRQQLLLLAKAVRKRLTGVKAVSLGSGEVDETWSDGYFIVIGTAKSDPHLTLELWVDRFTGFHRPTFQWCTSSTKVERVEAAERAAAPLLSTATLHRTSLLGEASTLRMDPPLPDHHYERPLLEVYRDREQAYFGVFTKRQPSRSSELASMAGDAARFFEIVSSSVAEAQAHERRERRLGFMPSSPGSAQEAAVEAAERRRESRGRTLISAAARKALELYGMDKARAWLRTKYPGCSIEDVSSRQAVDLVCTTSAGVLHVEVKCTQRDGSRITLTRNEVELARRRHQNDGTAGRLRCDFEGGSRAAKCNGRRRASAEAVAC